MASCRSIPARALGLAEPRIAAGVARRTYHLKDRSIQDEVAGAWPFVEVPLEGALFAALTFALNQTVWGALDGTSS